MSIHQSSKFSFPISASFLLYNVKISNRYRTWLYRYWYSIRFRLSLPLFPASATTTYKCPSRSMALIAAHTQYTVTSPNTRKNIWSDHVYVQCSRRSSGMDLMFYPKMPRIRQRPCNLIHILHSMLPYPFTLPRHHHRTYFISIAIHKGQECANTHRMPFTIVLIFCI